VHDAWAKFSAILSCQSSRYLLPKLGSGASANALAHGVLHVIIDQQQPQQPTGERRTRGMHPWVNDRPFSFRGILLFSIPDGPAGIANASAPSVLHLANDSVSPPELTGGRRTSVTQLDRSSRPCCRTVRLPPIPDLSRAAHLPARWRAASSLC